jgi:hypothetical protein
MRASARPSASRAWATLCECRRRMRALLCNACMHACIKALVASSRACMCRQSAGREPSLASHALPNVAPVCCSCSNAVRGAGDAERELLPGTMPAGGAAPSGAGGALPPPPALSAKDAKRMRKAQKKASKEARRAEKKVRFLGCLYPCKGRSSLRHAHEHYQRCDINLLDLAAQEKRKATKALKKAKKEAERRATGEEGGAPAAAQPDANSSGSEPPDSSDSAGEAAERPRPSSGLRTDREAHASSPARDRGRRQRHDTPSPDRRDGGNERSRGDRYRGVDRDSPGRRERMRSRSPPPRRRH